MNRVLKIEGMSCGHCENRVKTALATVPDLKVIRVSASEDIAELEAENEAVFEAAIEAIEDAGYDVIQ